MPFQLACPSCSRELRVPDSLIGQRVKCPTCMVTFTAEEPAAASPPPLPSQAPPPSSPSAVSSPPPHDFEPPVRPPSRRDEPYERRRDYDDRDEPPFSRRPDFRDRGFRADALPHRAGLVLTLGIISIVLCVNCCWLAPLWGMGFGIPAWIMGQIDLGKMRAGVMDPDGESNTKAGWICGIIGTCIGVLGLFGLIGFILLVSLSH
jgi:hypothetical protein